MNDNIFGTGPLETTEISFVAPAALNEIAREHGGRVAFRPAAEEDERRTGEKVIEPLFLRVVDQVGTGELIRIQVDTFGGDTVSSVVMRPDDLQELLDEAL